MPTSDPSDDRHLGELLIARGLVSPDELKVCRDRQQALRRDGISKPLAEILVEDCYATPTQIARVLPPIDDDSMYRSAQPIPGFQILSKLGQGAMATVFKAKQLSLDKLVAIKVLPKRLSENQEALDRFYGSGQLAARLSHPNVVSVTDVGEASGCHYLVMDYVEGRPLSELFGPGRVMPEGDALAILLHVARGLEHYYKHGLVHRGVTPRNIMVPREGEAKLCPSLLVRSVTDYEIAEREAGRVFGAPYYMSPEQVRGEINLDFRLDIYALGAVLYHMLTGRPPFDGSTPNEVMHKHLKVPLVPADHVRPGLSVATAELIDRAMAKQRDDRHPTATRLIQELESILER